MQDEWSVQSEANPQMGQPHLKVSRHQLLVLKHLMPGLGHNSLATPALVMLSETTQ